MVRELLGFDAAQSLVDSGVELGSYGLHRNYIESAESLFHLLQNQPNTTAELLDGAFRLEGELKVIHHSKKWFDCVRNCIVARILALLRLAFAGIVELRLQPS